MIEDASPRESTVSSKSFTSSLTDVLLSEEFATLFCETIALHILEMRIVKE
jgi:hypothetical protein